SKRGPARRRDTRQGIQLDRTCRPRRGAGGRPLGEVYPERRRRRRRRARGREKLMFLWIAQQLHFPGVLNLFRYITFRAGAATATALFLGLLIGPKFIG